MSNHVIFRVWPILLSLLLSGSAQPLLAHGGGLLQVAAEPVGPYKISVWTSPTRLEAGGPGHITVGVAGEADAPVLDAVVVVQMKLVETGEIVTTTPATTAQSTNKLFYEADIILPEIGSYDIIVQLDGSQGRGEVTFPIEVQPVGHTNWFLLGFIVLGLAISMFLFRLWEKQSTSPIPRQR